MLRLCTVLLSLLLLACAGDPPRAPVEDRRGVPGTVSAKPATHRVVAGDTLYAIAWRYGMDYRALARANGVARPYTIFPGQVLRLDGSKAAASRKTARTSTSKPVAKPGVKQSPAPAKTTAVKRGPVSGWRWPTSGKVVRGFSGTVHKGIDIAGKAGDAVAATAAGEVVYAGSGIVGYGKLLIVKHNETYLSAYGHNRKLLVGEGETVAAGQRIAEKGSSATNSVKLHFEIRREGKPIDPKKLLPPR